MCIFFLIPEPEEGGMEKPERVVNMMLERAA